MQKSLYVLLFAGLLLVSACSSTRPSGFEDPEAYRREIASLNEKLIRNPENAEALRDLGLIYLRTDQPTQAYDYLQKAFSRDPRDPSTICHLGLASELVGKREEAFRLYSEYPSVSSRSVYRDRLGFTHAAGDTHVMYRRG